MNDEDFKQTVIDYINMVTTQRHRDIMTSNQNVMDEITKLTAALTQLSTTITTAISDLGAGGDAARAGFVTAVQGAETQVATMQTDLTAAIAAVTSPPAAA